MSRRWTPGIVLTMVAMLVIALGVPLVVDQFGLLQLTVFGAMCILALSLGFVWGYGGILCFGQSAFFGLGAYTYAVTAINVGESTIPTVLAGTGAPRASSYEARRSGSERTR